MNMIKHTNGIQMHTQAETMFSDWQVAEKTEIRKYYIVQEREVGYRFALHQHPYVQSLTQRLLREGTRGLQAADTEYVDGDTARPDSIRFALDKNKELIVPAGSRVALRKKETVTVNGAPFDLEANLAFTLGPTPDTRAKAPDGLHATLIGGMRNLPSPGSSFIIPDGRQAIIQGNTLIKLTTSAPIVLPGGTIVSLPKDTELALANGTQIPIPNGTNATLIDFKRLPVLYAPALARYFPNLAIVQRPYAVEDLDFSYGGAYSIYNWELFFHVPLTAAIHLSKNQRFAEAQRWFHYLFDPTDSSEEPTPDRFWKVLPFHTTDVRKVEEILVNLVTGADPELRDETILSINAWKAAPFRPHVIARYRQPAYMFKTVMAYLDNLITWGDSLFRQDTGEAIDEALMLYVLAANILGPPPQPVPVKGSIRPQTYHNLREDLKHFGSVLRELEADPPFDLAPAPLANTDDGSGLATVRSLGRALYFCVPRNDKLLSYWDTVADRLFKIRNSLNIQGTFRQLALFEPPIDPALLARAAAVGLDVGAIINGLNQPLPLVRFQLLVQKAAEIAQEVKSLGNNLLSAMEKEDNEALAILRARHERLVMEMVEHVKYGQLQEAIKTKEGLLESLALAKQRFKYYELQMGKTADEIEKTIPDLGELDRESLDKMKFSMREPEMQPDEITVDIAKSLGDSGGKLISSYESEEFEKEKSAQDWRNRSSLTSVTASASYYIPTFGTDVKPWGIGLHIDFGGEHVGPAIRAMAEYFGYLSAKDSYDASRAKNLDVIQRREQDWSYQSNLAVGEINQIFKQLRAAQIREAIAEQELKSHRQQIMHADEIERFLNEAGTEKTGKTTNQALYAWMKREVKGLYAQSFQFAFDIAKKAERALQHELGEPSLTYLAFGYLSGKEGLLAGEKLYMDVKRMEMAYHELNQREYELTKHVSLLQVDPLALVQLRATGRCTVQLPESLFDMDGPGHYFRRIKTVAVSIPCVTGPYASVNCKLTLLKSSIRKTPILGEQYVRVDAEDGRFSDYFGSLHSIVTSSAQNDSGLFETNLRDERYLPFENSGVIGEWQLELPADPSKGDPAQFDYGTISDVILHIRYTAREGGGLLRKGALDTLKDSIDKAQAAGSVRLFSARHEFPTEWSRFQSQKPDAYGQFELLLNLREEHYPFWSQDHLEKIVRSDLFAEKAVSVRYQTAGDVKAKLLADALFGSVRKAELPELKLKQPSGALEGRPIGELKLFFDDKALEDLWIAVTWGNE